MTSNMFAMPFRLQPRYLNPRAAIAAVCTLVFVLFVTHWKSATPDHTRASRLSTLKDTVWTDLSAGNSTLGFQAILALSRGTKWRIEGIEAAAKISSIDVQIPAQPAWSDEFIHAFKAFGPVEAHGAAMAWLGHIDLLKFVIQNRWGSALIFEDDVDWDVDVRKQTSLIADAVVSLTRTKATSQAPYGLEWDVLWMGHCSDPPYSNPPGSIVIFNDPTAIPLEKYSGIDPRITEVVKEGQRSVHYSRNPVCSFAYAVSAVGAQKLLHLASLGHGGAFDLMMMQSCQNKNLTCVSVNPEIFHPYDPAEGGTSEVRAGDAGADFNADVGKTMGRTLNVLHSARCMGLFGTTCLS